MRRLLVLLRKVQRAKARRPQVSRAQALALAPGPLASTSPAWVPGLQVLPQEVQRAWRALLPAWPSQVPLQGWTVAVRALWSAQAWVHARPETRSVPVRSRQARRWAQDRLRAEAVLSSPYARSRPARPDDPGSASRLDRRPLPCSVRPQ